MSTTQTQTHIVYRNRLEHDFYESGMLIPLIGALLAGFVVFLALAALFERASRRWSIGKLTLAEVVHWVHWYTQGRTGPVVFDPEMVVHNILLWERARVKLEQEKS